VYFTAINTDNGTMVSRQPFATLDAAINEYNEL
jgi:hypothetical protein